MRLRIPICLLAGVLVALAPVLDSHAADIMLPNGVEVPVVKHEAKGDTLFLWLPSGFNSQRAEVPLAKAITRRGIEVWQTDLLDARLLLPVESSLEQIPAEDIAYLIGAAARTGKRVVIVASARAGILALAGAQRWLQDHPDSMQPAGLILLHPNLYVGPPVPGQEAEYHPAVEGNRVPVFIFQPNQSPWRWRLGRTRDELGRGGAAVYSWLLNDVRDRFYFRPDATEDEARASHRFAGKLQAAASAVMSRPHAVSTTNVATSSRRGERGQRGLQVYRGTPTPPPLELKTMDGKTVTLRDLKGKVVLLNFWATWCPPCVNEMPSMNRLRHQLAGQPFEILAINMAETDSEVRAFLAEKVHVDFPVLMDSQGMALRDWNVFVFPTSYVIGMDGRARLGAFGELEWDHPDIKKQIIDLLPNR